MNQNLIQQTKQELLSSLQNDSPGKLEIYLKLSKICYQQYQFTSAIQFGSKALALSLANGNLQQSIETGSCKSLPEILNILGLVLYQAEDYENAQTYFEKGIEFLPDDLQCNIGLAKTLLALGNQEKAQELFNKMISIDNKYVDAYIGLGNTFKSLNKIQLAEEKYRQALKIDPQHGQAYYCLGSLFDDQDNLNSAQQYYKKAIFYDAKCHHAYNRLAKIYICQRKIQQAKDYLNRSIQGNPSSYHTMLCLGDLYLADDNLQQSAKWYAKSIERSTSQSKSDNIYAKENIVVVYYCLHRDQQAQSIIYQLLRYFKANGNDQKLEEYSRMALKYNPDFAKSYYCLGIVYQGKKQYEQAIQYFQKSMQVDAEFQESCQSSIGHIYRHMGKYQSAIAQYDKCLKLQPNQPLASLSKINTLFIMGRQFEAYQLFRSFCSLFNLQKQSDRLQMQQKYNLSNGNMKYLQQKHSQFIKLSQIVKQKYMVGESGQKLIKQAKQIVFSTFKQSQITLAFDNLTEQQGQTKQKRFYNKNDKHSFHQKISYQSETEILEKLKEIQEKLIKLEGLTGIKIRDQFSQLLRKDTKLAVYYRQLVTNICITVDSYRALKTGIFQAGNQPIKSTMGTLVSFLQGAASIAEKIPLIDKFASMVSAVGKVYLGLQADHIANCIISSFNKYVSRQQLTNAVIQMVINLSKNEKFKQRLMKDNQYDLPWYLALKQKYEALADKAGQINKKAMTKVTGFQEFELCGMENQAREHCVHLITILITKKYANRLRYSENKLIQACKIFIENGDYIEIVQNKDKVRTAEQAIVTNKNKELLNTTNTGMVQNSYYTEEDIKLQSDAKETKKLQKVCCCRCIIF